MTGDRWMTSDIPSEIYWLTLTAAFTVLLWLPYGY
jgi:hypothetical protein